MTYLEVLYQWTTVRVLTTKSQRWVHHPRLSPFVGKTGVVIRESKNNQLLVAFNRNNSGKYIVVSVPPSCVEQIEDVQITPYERAAISRDLYR